jgi:hypothetical protein
VLALAAAWRAQAPSYPWPEDFELAQKLRVGLAVALLAGASELLHRRADPAPRLSLAALVAAACLALFHYTNLGNFHYPHFAHRWEQFHYALGARYFAELGYDGLYVASLAAEAEAHPERTRQVEIRDLRSNALVPTAQLAGELARVRERFGPERWREFCADHAFFADSLPPAWLAQIRRDHGYNPTPAWTAVARAAMAGLPIGPRALALFASYDVALLAALFAALARSFGARIALYAVVLFGAGYPGRFSWTGGALLRHDWIAAVGFGACALARGRAALAGACLGYAAAVRLFPAALLVGPAALAAAQLARGERPRWFARAAAGFAIAIAALGAAGALGGRGVAGWGELAKRMEVYQLSRGRNVVGLDGLVLYGGDAFGRAFDSRLRSERFDVAKEEISLRRRTRAPALIASQFALLALLGMAAARARPEQALVLSSAAIFALVAPAGYYWSVLSLTPIAVPVAGVFAQLGLDLGLHALGLAIPDRLLHSTIAAGGLLALFCAWLAPGAARAVAAWRRHRS